MTFDEWLDEIENFASRRERLNEDVDLAAVMTGNLSHHLAKRRMYEWLEAAYKVGYNVGYADQHDSKNDSQKINEIQRDVGWIVQYLLKTQQPIQPPPFNPQSNTCSRCKMDLSGVMGFVCGDPHCPTFSRVTSITYAEPHQLFARKAEDGYNG